MKWQPANHAWRPRVGVGGGGGGQGGARNPMTPASQLYCGTWVVTIREMGADYGHND